MRGSCYTKIMTDFLLYLALILFGLAFGSFIAALSYRSLRGISIFKGRSFCDGCGKKIKWYDNIPVMSFYFLKGKSRCCGKTLSLRYPLIEFFTMLFFIMSGHFYLKCFEVQSAFCVSKDLLGFFALPYQLFIGIFLIAIFVTDIEKKLIFDRFVFIPYAVVFLILILVNPDYSYINILLSFASAVFFLTIHLATSGKGMGLGDVKLALLPPLILGWPFTLIWLFMSFVIGSVVGVGLIFLGKAKFGKQIPFGPFLIISYFLVLFWGEKLLFLVMY